MKSFDKIYEINLVLYPDVLDAVVQGLTVLFRVTNKLSELRYTAGKAKSRTLIRVTHHQLLVNSPAGLTPGFDSHSDLPSKKPHVVIIPPSLDGSLSSDMTKRLSHWLRAKHKGGAIICSICSGGILLGETGLLSGRTATTHWTFAAEFAKRFPDVIVQSESLVVDDGDIITAGGLMAWTDLGLHLVARLLSPSAMRETAQFMLLDPPGREQRFYSTFSPELMHGDQSVLKVQHWLQSHLSDETRIPDLARIAGLEERTFLRRFTKATGLKPTEYCQALRIHKARETLEHTNRNIDDIAWSVGYRDPGAFRKVFRNIVGLTPGEYRSRFSV